MTDLQRQTPPTPDTPPAADAAADVGVDDRGHPVRLAVLGGLVVLLGLTGGWPMLVVVLGVVVMIFLHELGHYLAAKWSGMKVTEFFIGFGPKIWSFRKGETEYGLKAIPAGAYVKIIGMNNLDETDPADEDRTYRSKSYPKRMLVAVAGSAMHFAQAIVLLFLLFAVVGIPGGGLLEDRTWSVADVVPQSAADDAGLLVDDRIEEIDGRDIETFTSLREEVVERPGDEVLLTVRRDGETLQVPLTIGTNPDAPSQGLIGIRSQLETTTVPIPEAAQKAVTSFGEQTTATLGFLGDFFTPSGISEFAGKVADGQDGSTVVEPSTPGGEPTETYDDGRVISIVGAVQLGANLTENGMLGFLVFFVGINITIGIFNLLPLLPLDGGHVVVATYERVRELFTPKGVRYHVDFARLLPVVYAVFLLLVLLGVSTIYLDITDPV